MSTFQEEKIIDKASVRVGSNRSVYVIDGRINYEYRTAGVVAYCTYNELLYRILQDKKLSPSMSSHVPGKIQLRKRSAVEIKGYCTLAELCGACYYGKITSVETWTRELARFRQWMRNLHFEIDHADSNQLNCTAYNLSIMSAATNKRKNAITANIKQPEILFCGRFGKEYRIQAIFPCITRKDGHTGVCLKLKCTNAKDFSACLKEIYSIGDGYGESLLSTQSTWRNGRPCATALDVGLSLYGQELLANMESDSLQKCKAGQVKQYFLEHWMEQGMCVINP